MPEDNIFQTDLFESCANGDGTYNGYKLVQMLYQTTTGKEMSDEEARALVQEVVDSKKA